MDITIETAVVALVALVAAVAILGVATGQIDTLISFGENQTSNANCQILKTQFENGQLENRPSTQKCPNADSWSAPS